MPLPKEERYTLSDALKWDEQEHIELLEGTPIMMAPPSRAHQEISGALFAQLHNYLDGKKCRVYAAPFAVRLFERPGDRPENVDTLVEPDLSVVCDPGINSMTSAAKARRISLLKFSPLLHSDMHG